LAENGFAATSNIGDKPLMGKKESTCKQQKYEAIPKVLGIVTAG